MKTYVTFGQSHIHTVNGKVFDKDCVAVIQEGGRALAQELFGLKFFTTYTEEQWDESKLAYFPRGYMEVEQ